MINIENLDYETKLYALFCGLWSMNLSEPLFFEKMNDCDLIRGNKEQNLGEVKIKYVKSKIINQFR